MSSDAARFDTIIASLLRDPAQRANGRDLRRAYESLKHTNDLLNEDLTAERREHVEAAQDSKELVSLRAELERTRTAAEHYKNQAHTASLTLSKLNVRLEQTIEEKKQAEDTIKELMDELSKNTSFHESALPPSKPVAAEIPNPRLQKSLPTTSDQPSSSQTMRSRKRLADTDNEEATTHDRPAKRLRNAKVADGSARISAVSTSKLSVRRYITSSTPSIWDSKCKLTLPPLAYKGAVYECGDIVLMRNRHGRVLEDGERVRGDSDALPDALIAVLCDYSTTNPWDGKVKHPNRGEGRVKWVAIMEIVSKYKLQEVVQRQGPPSGDNVNITVEPDLDDELSYANDELKSFMSTHSAQRRCFLSTRLDWIRADDICGHVSPNDVGLAGQGPCTRTVAVDWRNHIINVQEKELHGKRWFEYGFEYGHASRSSPWNDVPDGWVDEWW